MPEPQDPIAGLLRTYADAVYRKDVEAFMALYDEAVCVFDTWGVWVYQGRQAWQGAVEGWLLSLGAERVWVETEVMRTHREGAFAAAQGFMTYTAVSEAGSTLRAMTNRFSWVLRQRGNAWTVVHEHTSAPADFETAQLVLQRQ